MHALELDGQGVDVLRIDQHAAARALHELRVGAAARRDDRHAAGHRLDEPQALRVVVGGRHGEDVEPLQEGDLLLAVDDAPVVHLVRDAPLPRLPQQAVEVAAMLRPEVARKLQAAALQGAASAEAVIGVAEQVQPLLGSDAPEVADRERPVPGSLRRGARNRLR